MFGRQYTILVGSARFSELKPDGTSWDAFGGAPDAFVRVKVDDESIGSTGVVMDRLSATWDEEFDAQLFQSSRLEFDVIDKDVTNNDVIAIFEVNDLETAIKNGGFSGSTTGETLSSFSFAISPR